MWIMSESFKDHNSDEMVVFQEFSSVGEAEVLRSVLQSAGIWSMINNEYMSTLYPISAIMPQLIIRSEDLAKAQEIMSAEII